MPFKKGNPGCCTCVTGPCGTITFTVRGCAIATTSPLGGLLSGATVTVYDGANNTFPVLGSGTTNASGAYAQAIGSAKTYYYEVSYPTRFNLLTGTVAAACSGASSTSVSAQLTVATGYACFTSGRNCVLPAKTTLFMVTPFGTVTLTRGILSGQPGWWGTLSGSCGNPQIGMGSDGNYYYFDANFGLLQGPFSPTSFACPPSLAVSYTSRQLGTCGLRNMTVSE